MARVAEIERIFARHRLGAVHSVQPLRGGQLNTALRINSDHVLRFREATLATGSLQREVAVLKILSGRVPAPEVVASGLDDLLGEYVIHQWIPGQNLLQAWLDNPDVSTREWWIREWTQAIRDLHEERFPRCGELPRGELKEYPSWRSYIESRIRKRLDLLMRIPSADRALVLTLERYLRRNSAVLEDGPFCMVHRDLHFANVIVDGPRVAAVVDFELAEVGTPDYELDTIFRFLRYPWLFAEPRVAAGVTPARFASVWIRLKRGYPEMFNVPYLRQRLCLYALDHDLSCLIQAYSGRWGENGVDPILGRIGEILQGRYGPE